MRDISAESVLLVDDDPTIRINLLTQLEEAGFETDQAEDGIEGLVKLRHKLPKVIISDLMMPRMSGIEFITVVRRRFPSIPVIVLSGSAQVELPAEAQPDVWLEKRALQIPELLQVVHDLARNAPDRANVPQVVSIPVRTHPGGAGYIVLACTDCLRIFEVMSSPEDMTVERTAVCVHCEARIPFLVESLEAA